MGRLGAGRLADLSPPNAGAPDPLDLDHLLLRLAGRPGVYDHALLLHAVWSADHICGMAAGEALGRKTKDEGRRTKGRWSRFFRLSSSVFRPLSAAAGGCGAG